MPRYSHRATTRLYGKDLQRFRDAQCLAQRSLLNVMFGSTNAPVNTGLYGTDEILQDLVSNLAGLRGWVPRRKDKPPQPSPQGPGRPAQWMHGFLTYVDAWTCRLSDKDQEETQRAREGCPHLAGGPGAERGWWSPRLPASRAQAVKGPCCLAEGPMVKTAGVWSGTRGQGPPVMGEGGLGGPQGANPARMSPGLHAGRVCWLSATCPGSARCLLSWA